MIDDDDILTRGKYKGLKLSDDAVDPGYLRFMYWRAILPHAVATRVIKEMIRRGVPTSDRQNNGKTGYLAKVKHGQEVREYKRLKAQTGGQNQ